MNPVWHAEATRLRREGTSVADIAAMTGKSISQVYKVVRAVRCPVNHHVASHMKDRPCDPDWHKKAVRLRRQGMRLERIARKFGVTRQAVSAVCRTAGLAGWLAGWGRI